MAAQDENRSECLSIFDDSLRISDKRRDRKLQWDSDLIKAFAG